MEELVIEEKKLQHGIKGKVKEDIDHYSEGIFYKATLSQV